MFDIWKTKEKPAVEKRKRISRKIWQSLQFKAVEDRDPVDTVNAGGDGEQTSSSAELIIQTPLADFTGF